jgi:glycosyltransferase involved in cell wall biosynthesis
MNILFVNNYNYSRGGAENVFLDESELLSKRGDKIFAFCRRHKNNLSSPYEKFFPSEMDTENITFSVNSLHALLNILYSVEAKRSIRRLMTTYTFDLAHVHNIYGRLTTSILDALNHSGIPVVMTLHDYKIICPNYKLMHHGRICEDCRNGKFYMAMVNRCHKNSLAASAIYSFETYFNHIFRKYRKNVSYFISPSQFLKSKLIEFGWPEERIKHIPNALPVDRFNPKFEPGDYFLYIGRLSSEKGISTLIEAFTSLKQSSIKLQITGEGPLEKELQKKAANDSRIIFTGYRTGNELRESIRNCFAVVVPSEWYENAPLSVLEAMAYGKPVIGANIGGIPEMIDHEKTGFLYSSSNADELKNVMEISLSLPKKTIAKMGKSARKRVKSENNQPLHRESLIALYAKAVEKSR